MSICNRYHCVKVSKYGVISGPYLVTQCTPNGHIQQQLSNIFLGKLQNFQFPVFQKKCFLMELYSFRTSARNSIFSKDAGLSPETSLKLVHSTRVFSRFLRTFYSYKFSPQKDSENFVHSQNNFLGLNHEQLAFSLIKKTKQNKTNKKVTLTYSEPYLETVARMFH